MKHVWQWAIVAVIPIICLGCRPVEQKLKTSEWVTSDDGALSLRLMAPKALIPADEPILLLAELRNNLDGPINVLRPFADTYVAWCVLEITGPDGPLNYTGEEWAYELGGAAFVTVPPGRTIRGRIELPVENFAGSDKPGRYTILSLYKVGSYYQELAALAEFCAESDLWIGEIRSEPITVTKGQ